MHKVAIYGAGGFGRVVAALLSASYEYEPYVVLDQAGGNVIGGEEKLTDPEFLREHRVLIAVGDNAERKRLTELFISRPEGIGCFAIHRKSIIQDVHVGVGSVICAGAMVGPNVLLGVGVIISTGASVAHDSKIADYANICDGAVLGGGVHVGEGAFIGLNATILPKVKIGAWSIIGAGAVVTEDVPDNTTAVGVPAKVIEVRSPNVA